MLRARSRLPRKRFMRCRRAPLPPESLFAGTRPLGRYLCTRHLLPSLVVACSLRAGLLRSRAGLRLWQLHTGTSGFGKSNRDRLLAGAGSVLSFPYVLDLFVDEFARLRGRSFPFLRILTGLVDCFLLGHSKKPRRFAGNRGSVRSGRALRGAGMTPGGQPSTCAKLTLTE